MRIREKYFKFYYERIIVIYIYIYIYQGASRFFPPLSSNTNFTPLSFPMAGGQDSVCFPGGAAFPSPMPQALHHCQSANPLCSSLLMSDGGPTHLPPGLGALQHELLSEPPYDLPQNSDEGRDSYCSQWERLDSSVSAPLKGYYPTISSVGSSLLPAGMIGFSPLVEGALQRDSVLDPRCSTVGSSMMPLEAEDFSAFGEVEIPCDSMAVQFNSPLPSSIDAGAASYCPSSYKESLPCCSAAPSTETSAICSNIPTAPQLAAASFHQAPEKHISCYPSSTIPVDESPSISSNEQMVHPQAELSERNDLDISIIWTIEEQQLLNEQLRRYLNRRRCTSVGTELS